ncbi:MAG: DUF4304 domain-containing protein [Fusobacterium sp.]|nr:DUF4304 domain-containing protein [Fusobacterium sp.]
MELIDDTKKFNTIYKKYFKEYFDKPLKKDGFYKKGTINFFRINKLGMVEILNFQRHYDRLTVNYAIIPIYCGVLRDSGEMGERLGRLKYQEDYWWDLRTEEEIKENMEIMLEVIQTQLYPWFKKMEDENEVIKLVMKSWKYTIIYNYLGQATTMAKFKRYNEIQTYIDKVKDEYKNLKERGFKRDWIPPILEEALLLEEKVKEGHKAIDEYIIEREKQSLRELGLEKLIK